MEALLQALQSTAVATAIREGETLFPWIECVHVLALTIVIGSIALLDLRLIGWTSRDRPVASMTAEILPITWSAFVLAVISGGLLFSSNAVTYAHNFFFEAKMTVLAAAGLNMSVYHLFLSNAVEHWHTSACTPWRARLIGAISLSLWIGVVALGRWIGFTINAPT